MNWLWRRMWSHSSDEPNRSHRRALARMTRPDRKELSKIIDGLKRLPLEQRAEVVSLLSESQQEKVRKYL
ncbi:hypothetical protein LCGC14_3047480 [marine sediment metagenome]|uniref:Uncharacterized protein n=1 Tax=marine sediment metagenome TaxID=412755 RepID=A0A0F8WMN0_9ZZZZ